MEIDGRFPGFLERYPYERHADVCITTFLYLKASELCICLDGLNLLDIALAWRWPGP